MLLTILEITLLLGAIVIPLVPRKNKHAAKRALTVDTDTRDAHYAINEHGTLEEVHQHGITDNP